MIPDVQVTPAAVREIVLRELRQSDLGVLVRQMQASEALRTVGPAVTDAAPFKNGWVNLGGAYRPLVFWKDRGVVHIVGAVKSGTNATVVFTLPAGYRPSAVIVAPLGHGWTGAANTITRTTVFANGDVQTQTDAGSNVENHIELHFRAEQ